MSGKLIVMKDLTGLNRLKQASSKTSVCRYKEIKLPDCDDPSARLSRMYLGGRC